MSDENETLEAKLQATANIYGSLHFSVAAHIAREHTAAAVAAALKPFGQGVAAAQTYWTIRKQRDEAAARAEAAENQRARGIAALVDKLNAAEQQLAQVTAERDTARHANEETRKYARESAGRAQAERAQLLRERDEYHDRICALGREANNLEECLNRAERERDEATALYIETEERRDRDCKRLEAEIAEANARAEKAEARCAALTEEERLGTRDYLQLRDHADRLIVSEAEMRNRLASLTFRAEQAEARAERLQREVEKLQRGLRVARGHVRYILARDGRVPEYTRKTLADCECDIDAALAPAPPAEET
jgi:chromosome segregation ATPase